MESLKCTLDSLKYGLTHLFEFQSTSTSTALLPTHPHLEYTLLYLQSMSKVFARLDGSIWLQPLWVSFPKSTELRVLEFHFILILLFPPTHLTPRTQSIHHTDKGKGSQTAWEARTQCTINSFTLLSAPDSGFFKGSGQCLYQKSLSNPLQAYYRLLCYILKVVSRCRYGMIALRWISRSLGLHFLNGFGTLHRRTTSPMRVQKP